MWNFAQVHPGADTSHDRSQDFRFALVRSPSLGSRAYVRKRTQPRSSDRPQPRDSRRSDARSARARNDRSGRPGLIPHVQTYPRRERGEPDCSRTPHGRSEDHVTNNSADTSVAGAMVLALWFARAPPHRIPLRSSREWLRGEDVSTIRPLRSWAGGRRPKAAVAHQGRRVSRAHTDRGEAPVSL